MVKMMKSLCIITARGGSKRIPKKNIKNFCGKPILAYSVEAALGSGLFEEVMVSTDSQEIAEIAEKYGAEVPFFRSEKNSDDYASTADVLYEVLMEYEKKGRTFDYFCCIYPTAPFITASKLRQAKYLLIEKNADSVLPVVKFSFPPQRGLEIQNEKVQVAYPEFFHSRSQDLKPIYHDCGQFYFLKTSIFMQSKKLITDNTIPIFFQETEVQDIDSEEDWEIAEIKYERFVRTANVK